jgi:predicted ester cyclase
MSLAAPPADEYPMEQNKAIVRRLIEQVINEHDLDAAERFFSADFVEHIPAPGQEQGLEGMRRWLEEVYFRAFPDVHWSAEEQVSEGDKVLTRFVWRGTHRGEFAGIAPTEERVEVWGMVLERIAEGKVVGSRILHDTVSLLQQMGVIMAPPDQSEEANPGGSQPHIIIAAVLFS